LFIRTNPFLISDLPWRNPTGSNPIHDLPFQYMIYHSNILP
jgi:hypothetical protein